MNECNPATEFANRAHAPSETDDSIEADLDRLRQSGQECADEEENEGNGLGSHWARKFASFRELKRVHALTEEDFADADSATMALAQATLGDETLSWDEVNVEMARLFEFESTPSVAHVLGFIEGASKVFEKV